MTFSCLNLSPGPAQARWPQARTRPKPELYNKSGPVPGPARKVPGPSPARPMDEVNLPGPARPMGLGSGRASGQSPAHAGL